MSYPLWTTLPGSLGTIEERVSFSYTLVATIDSGTLKYKLQAGRLPTGLGISSSGIITGTPNQVGTDVTSTFVIRAYEQNNSSLFADRTFSITVQGNDVPEFVTPAELLVSVNSGQRVSETILAVDQDPGDVVSYKLLEGELPDGLTLNETTGAITGLAPKLIAPVVYVNTTTVVTPRGFDYNAWSQATFDSEVPDTMTTQIIAEPGWDAAPWNAGGFQFDAEEDQKTFYFAIEVTDGKGTNTRQFTIQVNAPVSTQAATFYKEDGSLGSYPHDNYLILPVKALDIFDDALEYSIEYADGEDALPGDLQIDPVTGIIYGTVPQIPLFSKTYNFKVRATKVGADDALAEYSITFLGNTSKKFQWLTESYLGSVHPSNPTTYKIEGYVSDNVVLKYRFVGGRLPPGLSLTSEGEIIGTVGIEHFAIDSGNTTFDDDSVRFDRTYEFTVEAYSTNFAIPTTTTVELITTNTYTANGSEYIFASDVPIIQGHETVKLNDVALVAQNLREGIMGDYKIQDESIIFLSLPSLGDDIEVTVDDSYDVTTNEYFIVNRRTFSIQVDGDGFEPYVNVVAKSMATVEQRQKWTSILNDQSLIPANLLYRPGSEEFKSNYDAEFILSGGHTLSEARTFVSAMTKNFYRKQVLLGKPKMARAVEDGLVKYEVIYLPIVDFTSSIFQSNLYVDVTDLNIELTGDNDSITVDSEITSDQDRFRRIYPNSFVNMRQRLADNLGFSTPNSFDAYPLWMRSPQVDSTGVLLLEDDLRDGKIPYFILGLPLVYVKPGSAGSILFNFERARIDFNQFCFDIDGLFITDSLGTVFDDQETSFDETISVVWDSGTTSFDDSGTSFGGEASKFDSSTRHKYVSFANNGVFG